MRAAKLVGTVLAGKYRVDGIVGEGSTGVVLAATHLALEEQVAIKLLSPHAAATPGVLNRFLNEGRAAAQIRSQHIVRVRDVGRLEDGTPYTVMELLEGDNLATILHEHGPLPIEQAVDFILQACDALAEAHDSGVIHRDIKPENLVVTVQRNGQPCVKVLDFGISKLARDTQDTPTEAILGSPVYMSPEQLASSRSVDGRADIWSLGVTLFELIAGQAPFERRTFLEVRDAIMGSFVPDLTKYRREVPRELAEVIARCLYRDREARWATIREFAEAIAPWGTSLGIEALNARSSNLPRSVPPPSMRSRPAPMPLLLKPVNDEPTLTVTETETDRRDGSWPWLLEPWTRCVDLVRSGSKRWVRFVPLAVLLLVVFGLGVTAIIPVRPSAATGQVTEATAQVTETEEEEPVASAAATAQAAIVTVTPAAIAIASATPPLTATPTPAATPSPTLTATPNPTSAPQAPLRLRAMPPRPPQAPPAAVTVAASATASAHPRALPGDRK